MKTVSVVFLAVLVLGCTVWGQDHHHDEHSTEPKQFLRFSDEEIKRFEIGIEPAQQGTVTESLAVQGEIVLNSDTLSHIVPRADGVVSSIQKSLGDNVSAGELLAIIDSRDLADAKAVYLAARERRILAAERHAREERLWRRKVSSEQEYLDAGIALAETRIEERAAMQKLQALGMTQEALKDLPATKRGKLTALPVRAPIKGTVIKKQLTLGEVVKDEKTIYVVADLSTVWCEFRIHQKDLSRIKKGQTITIPAQAGIPATSGTVIYIDPVLDTETRTTHARIRIDNRSGNYRPGSFVNGQVVLKQEGSSVYVAKDAIQILDDEPCVFIFTEDGFETRPVVTGRTNDTVVEIVKGVATGERVVSRNGFRIKAELKKGPAGAHAGCGHAH
jgi:membrane fusion protein, heavy metal efflux system